MIRAFRFRDLLMAAALAVSLPLVAGFFSALHPAFDAAAHFRVHLAVLLALVSLPLLAGLSRVATPPPLTPPRKGEGDGDGAASAGIHERSRAGCDAPISPPPGGEGSGVGVNGPTNRFEKPICDGPSDLAGRFRFFGMLLLLFGIGSLATVSGLPGFGAVHASFHPRDPEAAVYRLLQLNLRFDNAEPGKVISLIGRIQPDVLTLEEVSPMWEGKLELLAAAYPYRFGCPTRPFGVAILSRRPLPESAGCSRDGALARSVADFGGRRVEIAVLHLDWPWPFGQPAQMDALEPVFGELSETALLAGDLNATPWSATARRVAEAGGLGRVGPLGPTWQYRMLPGFLRFAGLPIDQVFARGDVVVHAARTLEPVGSDHLPVLVEFSLKPPLPGPEPASSRLAGTVSGDTRYGRL